MAGCPEFTAREHCASLFQGSYNRQRVPNLSTVEDGAAHDVTTWPRLLSFVSSARVLQRARELETTTITLIVCACVVLCLLAMAAATRLRVERADAPPSPLKSAKSLMRLPTRANPSPGADWMSAPLSRPGTSRSPPWETGASPAPSAASLSPFPERSNAPSPFAASGNAGNAPLLSSQPTVGLRQLPLDGRPEHLCPELVVPQGSECTLMVPKVASTSAGVAPVVISDVRGVPVFKAASAPGQGAAARRLVLSSVTGEAIFTFCRDIEGPGLAVFNHHEQSFGELRLDGSWPVNGYSITTRRGWRVRFRGDLEGKHLNAIDDQGRLLAIMEVQTNSGSRSVRVGPSTDVGLVVIGVLGIDLLRQRAAEEASAQN